MHAVLDPRYLKRNPHLPFSDTVEDVSGTGPQAAVWPIAGDTTTASFMPGLMSAPHAGTFTAASGVHIHRGDALPAGHGGSIFVCESAQNLVQRQVLSPNGVTFTSRPATPGRDFLASRDTWFRPVFAANGPDGALYVVDMYRRIIDHPQYVPEQSRALLDFEAGRERGRIYRIAAADWKPDGTPVDLGRSNAARLVRLLEHRNAWWRETAQRLMVERRDRSAVPSLRLVARRSASGLARLHALWTLEGIGALEPEDLAAALGDANAAVRENAARLAEPYLRSSPVLLDRVLRLASDSDGRVRFRAALALGESGDPRRIGALASIARRDGADRWMRAAILSSIGDRPGEFLRAFASLPPPAAAATAAVLQDLGHLFGRGETPERCLDFIIQVTDTPGASSWQPAALSGLAQGLRGRRAPASAGSALMTLLSADTPNARLAKARVQAVVARASAMALDTSAAAAERLDAIRLLGYTDYSTAGAALETLLSPRHGIDVQAAAVAALSSLPEEAAARGLLESSRWQAFTPRIREAVLSALLTGEPQTLVLLDAIETGAIGAAALAPARRSRLTSHRNMEIRKRARSLFASIDSGDRMQAYERLRGAVLAGAADPARGKQVFAVNCAACHAIDGAGGQVGPDLSGIRNQPADAILLHVLVPDYEIAPGYQAYVVDTRDRRTLSGRLESEAPNSITLRDSASQQHVVLRSDVVSISASARSLMPSELERAMSVQDLADLIGYLKADRRPD
jgi:putative heme-binding domain-containing protein